MSDYGIRVNNSYIKLCELSTEGGRICCSELLQQKNKPEVIFPLNIDLTLGAFIEIKNKGLSIPKDVGLIGFDE